MSSKTELDKCANFHDERIDVECLDRFTLPTYVYATSSRARFINLPHNPKWNVVTNSPDYLMPYKIVRNQEAFYIRCCLFIGVQGC